MLDLFIDPAQFRLYQEQEELIEKLTLEDFAMTLVSHATDSVRSLLWQLHDLTVPMSSSMRMATIRQSPADGGVAFADNGDGDGAGDDRHQIGPKYKTTRTSSKKRRRRLLNAGIFQQFQDYFRVSCSLSFLLFFFFFGRYCCCC